MNLVSVDLSDLVKEIHESDKSDAKPNDMEDM